MATRAKKENSNRTKIRMENTLTEKQVDIEIDVGD